jgi:hypothetical protein
MSYEDYELTNVTVQYLDDGGVLVFVDLCHKENKNRPVEEHICINYTAKMKRPVFNKRGPGDHHLEVVIDRNESTGNPSLSK